MGIVAALNAALQSRRKELASKLQHFAKAATTAAKGLVGYAYAYGYVSRPPESYGYTYGYNPPPVTPPDYGYGYESYGYEYGYAYGYSYGYCYQQYGIVRRALRLLRVQWASWRLGKPIGSGLWDHAYVLNLDRRPDRLTKIDAQLRRFGINYTRIAGVDGTDPAVAEDHRTDERINRKQLPGVGIFGCLLGHIRILEAAKAAGHRRVLIFEDDAVLHRDFARQLDRVRKLPAWKMIYLGAIQINWDRVQLDGDRYLAEHTHGLHAYLLDTSCLSELLETMRSRQWTPDDAAIASVQKTHRGQVFVMWPNLAVQRMDYSDNRSDAQNAVVTKAARWDSSLYLFDNLSPAWPARSFSLNSIVDQVYVLNLDRRRDRWEAMEAKLAEVGLQAVRWRAIDGQSDQIKRQFAADKQVDRKRCEQSSGYACLLSHAEIILDAKKRGLRRILILEDDALFHKDFRALIGPAMARLPDDWKLIYLGATQLDWSSILLGPDEFYLATNTLGTFAYMLDCSAFDDALRAIDAKKDAVDYAMARGVQTKWRGKCFVLNPNLVIADLKDSDIRSDGANRWLAEHLKWDRAQYSDATTTTVTFGITAFNRPQYLERLVASILRFYPQATIIVADNGKLKAKLPPGVQVLPLPFDCGVSAARNALYRSFRTKYLLILEEDFIFTAETRVERFVDVLDSDLAVGLVGGALDLDGAKHDYSITISQFGSEVRLSKASTAWRTTHSGTTYRTCDMVFMFCLVRRELTQDLLWDERLVIGGEHLAYFQEMQKMGRWRTAYTPCVSCVHDRGGRTRQYNEFRGRAASYVERWRNLYRLAGPFREPGTSIPLPMHEKPNLIIFGVGHSGTSVVVKMAFQLGWLKGDADEKYGESVRLREFNQTAIIRSQKFDTKAASDLIAALPRPWALKDPRFVELFKDWLPIWLALEPLPLLLFLSRNETDLAVSYARRGELVAGRPGARGRELGDLVRLAEQSYQTWPGPKLRLTYEQLEQALPLFKAGAHGHG
jgi:GR25 family glycosyltransferase involved in LPS biosynthesis/GT2 family glycosyltransferase